MSPSLSPQPAALAPRVVTPPAPAPVPARVALLFESSADLAYRTAWRITGRAEDAEDVLQQVFLRVVQTFPPEPWPDNPVGWVRRAAANAALDVLRRRRRWALRPVDDGEGDALADQALDPETAALSTLDAARLAARLRASLARLSPLEAEVFALRAFDDLDNVAIAELLGKTPNHVGVTLHAARQKLKSALAETDPAGSAPDGGSR